jgi:predicted permease
VTVVGVMPPRFDTDADFWTPLDVPPASFARDDRQFEAFARLRDGASLAQARQDLEAISARLSAEHPETNRGWVMASVPMAQLHGRDSRARFLLLQAAVACVLLIACANIANVLLARGSDRRTEMSIRVSLGATRRHLIASSLTEALALSAAGGALAMVLAIWGIRLARSMGGFPDAIDPQLNVFVLAFAAALSLVTAILCGIVPALRASAVAPDTALRKAGRSPAASGGHRLRAALAGAQVAAALVLAIAAVLMLQTLANRLRVDVGFDPHNAVRGDLVLTADKYPDAASISEAVRDILDGIAREPETRAAGAVTWALPTGAGGQRALTVPSAHDAALSPSVRRAVEAVTPDYFAAYGIPIKMGRPFAATDREGGAAVAIVNEQLAAALWPGRSPVGEILRLGTPSERAPLVTIVGVAGTITTLATIDLNLEREVPELVDGHELRRESVERELHRLAALPLEERRHVRGLMPERAPTIVAGGAILAGILDVTGAPSLTVSERDILHGIALEAATLA